MTPRLRCLSTSLSPIPAPRTTQFCFFKSGAENFSYDALVELCIQSIRQYKPTLFYRTKIPKKCQTWNIRWSGSTSTSIILILKAPRATKKNGQRSTSQYNKRSTELQSYRATKNFTQSFTKSYLQSRRFLWSSRIWRRGTGRRS